MCVIPAPVTCSSFGFCSIQYLSFKLATQASSAPSSMASKIECPTIEKDTARAIRIKIIAPVLIKAIDDFNQGRLKMGVEAFDTEIKSILQKTNLLEHRVVDVTKAGIHPDNREGDMAIAVDVQDLLDRMTEDGWNPSKWSALAATIPAGAEGERWRKLNAQLIQDSNDYLAAVIADDLEVVTSRGTHGTCALRCAKIGAKSMHPHLAVDGNVSKEIILELAPSLRDPIENGVEYDIIPGELCLAVPKLMETLSRHGNSFNDVYRLQSSLQICQRIHKLSTASDYPSWDDIAKLAAKGNGGKNFQPKARQLCDFVHKWSGGNNAFVLKQLELYEKSMDTKRKLAPADLQTIGKLELSEGRYILALVKAMLNSPTSDTAGYSDLFSHQDFLSLNPGCKNHAAALDAAALMCQAEQFVKAYSRLDFNKFISKLEVRCVMYVHSKKAHGRTNYESLDAIAMAFFGEIKKADPKLPAWSRIKDQVNTDNAKGHGKPIKAREVHLDGSVPDSELEARQFVVGAFVQCKKTGQRCKIVAVKPNFQEVRLAEIDDAGTVTDDQPSEVSRKLFLVDWVHYKLPEIKYLKDFPDLTVNTDILAAIIRGQVVDKCLTLFSKSAENDIQTRLEPSKVFVSLKVFQSGSLKLYPLSYNVLVLPTTKDDPAGGIFLGMSEELNISVWIRSCNSLKDDKSKFASLFFLLHSNTTDDARKANCERHDVDFVVKVAKNEINLKIPMISNNEKIEKDTEIMLLSFNKPKVEVPASKKQKLAAKPKAQKK